MDEAAFSRSPTATDIKARGWSRRRNPGNERSIQTVAEGDEPWSRDFGVRIDSGLLPFRER
jgi:hypothetical protein